MDRLLAAPVYGPLRYMRENLNFLFAMEMLTAGGLAVEAALQEAEEVPATGPSAPRWPSAREGGGGRNLSAAFLSSPFFSSRFGRWVAVGERAGQVERFRAAAPLLPGGIERWSTRFMSLVEPVLVLGVGLIGLLVIVFFFVTPIFSIYEGIL